MRTVCSYATLVLMLLVGGSLRRVVNADQAGGQLAPEAGSSARAPAGSSTPVLATNCPAELILSLLKNSRDLQLQLRGASKAQSQPLIQLDGATAKALPIWPPPALQQGLSCTMELSQLSVALPGTNKVCTVLSITNNLLSTLFSWQLVYTSQGLTPSSATGAVLLNSTGADSGTVQLINPTINSSIPARGGSVDMLVQLGLPLPSPPPAPPAPEASEADEKGKPQNRSRPAPRPPPVRPAAQSVLLNGLQCTRLPLARPSLGASRGSAGLVLDDCGTVEWGVGANGTLLLGEESPDRVGSWEAFNLTSISSGAPLNQSLDVGTMLAALWQLSCASQLCCGLQVLPSSVVDLSNSTDGATNSTEPPVVATDGPTPAKSAGLAGNVPTSPIPESLPSDITPAPPAAPPVELSSSDNRNTVGLVVGLVVAGVVVGCLGAALVVVLLRNRNAKRRRALLEQEQKLQAAQQGLVRHGSGASTGSGAASLASVASAEWQQQQQHYTAAVLGRPPVPWLRGGPQYVLPTHQTAPPQLISEAAAVAAAELSAGSVWRAGSWQGPDAYTPNRAQLTRTFSSPSPLLRTTTASTAASSHPTQPAPLLAPGSTPNSPSMALHLPHPGPSRSNSHPSPALGAAAAVAGGSSSTGPFGVPSAGSTAQSSLGSTWGALRHFMGGNRVQAPQSSLVTSVSNSTLGLVRHGSHAAGYDSSEGTHSNVLSAAAAAAATPAAATHGDQLALAHYRPPLQLIQEAAPLASSAYTQALGQQQLQLLASTGASTYMGLLSGAGDGGGVAVSRRISPILSVHEDASSATSTDSMTPAAWHLTDRQLLEDTPGWLNIDFASEVRLEKKLGEGGFGQVFRARWRGEVLAAKLVPFMSIVAQQHHSMGLSLLSAAPDAAAAAHAAGSGQPTLHSGSAASQLGGMRLGVQFSSASLRAIKVEIRVLSQLSHPNIVSFKGACLAPPHICILEELAEGGSLYSRLYSRSSASKAQQRQQQQGPSAATSSTPTSSTPAAGQPRTRKGGPGGSGSSRSQPPPPLTVAEVLRIAVDVSRAMLYLHTLQPQVVHRDLKPQNVLLDLQGRAKVCDFGISKMKDASLAASSTRLQAGTPAYMAPEQFEGCSVTDKVDVFAFGVMLWECFEQQQPWKELSPMQIIYAVGLQKERLQRPSRCPDLLWQLIEACWAQDPRDRPSFADTLQTLQQMQQQLADAEQCANTTDKQGRQQQSSASQLLQLELSVSVLGQSGSQQAPAPGCEETEEVDAHVAVVC